MKKRPRAAPDHRDGFADRGDANPNANPNAPYKVEKSQNDKFTEELRDTPKQSSPSRRK
jgi:hypothetical protein